MFYKHKVLKKIKQIYRKNGEWTVFTFFFCISSNSFILKSRNLFAEVVYTFRLIKKLSVKILSKNKRKKNCFWFVKQWLLRTARKNIYNHQWIRVKIALKLLHFFFVVCCNSENFQVQRLYNFTYITTTKWCAIFFLKYVQKKYIIKFKDHLLKPIL